MSSIPEIPVAGAGLPGWTPERMLARLDGDVELARQLAEIFVEECPRMLARLREALAGGSADELRRAAHAAKGSIANFVDDGPTASAFELETLGRQEQLDEAAAILDRLEREATALANSLHEFQSSASS